MRVRAAIAALAGTLEGHGITCAVVDLERPDLTPACAAAVATASAGKRMLFRATDDAWPALVATCEGAPVPEWIACEPLLEKGMPIGALVVTGQTSVHVPALTVDVVDATAAGDSFCAGLVDAMLSGADVVEATRFATRVASVTVTRPGAMDSLPYRSHVAPPVT